MKHYIYKTTNLINGKIYIGKRSHDNPEKDKYLGSGNVLKQAISKYGKQNFKKEILEIFLTEEQAYQKQSQLVTMQFIQRNDTYNICPGGRGGRKGMVVVKTQSDKIIVIPNNNENYLNGTWVSIHKGKVIVKDKEGKCFSVDVNDPRYINGQLKGCNQGKFVAIDNEGKYIYKFKKAIRDLNLIKSEQKTKAKLQLKTKKETLIKQINLIQDTYQDSQLEFKRDLLSFAM